MEISGKLKKYAGLTQKAFALDHPEDIISAFVGNILKVHSTVSIDLMIQELDLRIKNLEEYIAIKGTA